MDDVDKQVWELTTNVPRVSKPIAIVAAVLVLRLFLLIADVLRCIPLFLVVADW